MHQLDLLEYGTRLRDAGMATAAARSPAWGDLAYQAIITIARRQPELHTDDLLTFCIANPAPSKYAMGPVWMRAIKDGVIEDTGRMRRASDPIKHAKKMSVYSSRLYRAI